MAHVINSENVKTKLENYQILGKELHIWFGFISVKLYQSPTRNMLKFVQNTFIYSLIKTLFEMFMFKGFKSIISKAIRINLYFSTQIHAISFYSPNISLGSAIISKSNGLSYLSYHQSYQKRWAFGCNHEAVRGGGQMRHLKSFDLSLKVGSWSAGFKPNPQLWPISH